MFASKMTTVTTELRKECHTEYSEDCVTRYDRVPQEECLIEAPQQPLENCTTVLEEVIDIKVEKQCQNLTEKKCEIVKERRCQPRQVIS